VTGASRALVILIPSLAAALSLGCAGRIRPSALPPAAGRSEGFRAQYRLQASGENRIRKARLIVAYLPPRQLRLEILDSLGASRSVLVSTDQGALLMDPVAREYRLFSGGEEAFAALAGASLDPDLLPALLLANPYMGPGLRCQPPRVPREPLICGGGEGNAVLRVWKGGEEWEVLVPQREALHARLRWGPGNRAGAPREIHLQGGRPEFRADLFLLDMLPGAPPADLFPLRPPDSFRLTTESSVPEPHR
jgi:hypothetical protein